MIGYAMGINNDRLRYDDNYDWLNYEDMVEFITIQLGCFM